MPITNKCPICGKELPSGCSSLRKYCSERCARIARRHYNYSIVDKANRKKAISRHDRYGLYITYAQECALCGFTTRTDRTIGILFNVFFHGDGFIDLIAKEYREQARKDLKLANGGCELHHVVPISEGGGYGPENMILLCPNCHKAVHQGLIPQDVLLSKVEKYKPEELLKAIAEVIFR